MIFSVLVLCNQLRTVEYDVRAVTLMLVRLRSSVSRADWASIPKVVGSIPTVHGQAYFSSLPGVDIHSETE